MMAGEWVSRAMHRPHRPTHTPAHPRYLALGSAITAVERFLKASGPGTVPRCLAVPRWESEGWLARGNCRRERKGVVMVVAVVVAALDPRRRRQHSQLITTTLPSSRPLMCVFLLHRHYYTCNTFYVCSNSISLISLIYFLFFLLFLSLTPTCCYSWMHTHSHAGRHTRFDFTYSLFFLLFISHSSL